MMKDSYSSSALIMIDFINEIVSKDGKLAGKGYTSYIEENSTDQVIEDLLSKFRAMDVPIIHVRIGFAVRYSNHPANSPLFGAARKHGALRLPSWGTQFADFAEPQDNELIIDKHRVSAFYGTSLELSLRSLNIERIFLAGCATDLAVQSAARDAHDRDFSVVVVDDACAAASAEDHESSLNVLRKIGEVVRAGEL